MGKLFLAFCLLLGSCFSILPIGLSPANAVPTEPAQSLDPLKQQGKLVSVKIVLGEPIKIFVVGREEAQIDLSNLKLVVKRLAPHAERSLKVRQHPGYFSISESVNMENSMDLEVTTEIPGKHETFHFEINKRKP